MSTETNALDAPALTLAEAAKLPPLRINGKQPAVTTLWRWADRGIERDGRRIKLATWRIGRRVMTDAPSVIAFLERLNDPAVPATDTPSARADSYRKACATLAAAGL